MSWRFLITECPAGEYLSNNDPGTCTSCGEGTITAPQNSATQCTPCSETLVSNSARTACSELCWVVIYFKGNYWFAELLRNVRKCMSANDLWSRLSMFQSLFQKVLTFQSSDISYHFFTRFCLFWCFLVIVVCPAGNFLNPQNNDLCEECPIGSWNSMIDQTSCNNCTGDQTTERNGTDSQNLCGKFSRYSISLHAWLLVYKVCIRDETNSNVLPSC